MSLETLRQRISNEGPEKVIEELATSDFSDSTKEELEKAGILVGGYPNLTLLLSI